MTHVTQTIVVVLIVIAIYIVSFTVLVAVFGKRKPRTQLDEFYRPIPPVKTPYSRKIHEAYDGPAPVDPHVGRRFPQSELSRNAEDFSKAWDNLKRDLAEEARPVLDKWCTFLASIIQWFTRKSK